MFIFGIMIFSVAFIYMIDKVNHQLKAISKVAANVVQWNFSQAELEHSRLLEILLRAKNGQDISKDDITIEFDIFYSRITTINTGKLYAEFRDDPTLVTAMPQIETYLETWAPILDDPQTTVASLLPDFFDDTASLRVAVREISLASMSHSSEVHVVHRDKLFSTLLGILLLSCFLLVLLLFLIGKLARLNFENKTRANQIEDDRAHMDAIVAASLEAIIVTDQDGVIHEFKGAAAQIFNYVESDVLTTHISRLIHVTDGASTAPPRPHQNVSAALEKFIGQGRVLAQGRRKSGKYFPAEVAIKLVKNQEKSMLAVFARDISNEVEAAQKLRQARDSAVAGERSKSQLLAVMSHEIRTPLNGLIGSMELLRESNLTEPQQEYLTMMSRSGSLLLSHVNNVLDISRMEAGQLDLQRKVFNLTNLIAEIIDGQRGLATERDNTFVIDHDTGAFWVESDRLRLSQILLNIISNANKFTYAGEVRVEVEATGRHNIVEIRVADTGIGIADDQTARIFQDFATGDASYTRHNEGTGLGLGIARRIARAMGGDIYVVSELGEGSIFTISLPIAATDPANTEMTSPDLLAPAARSQAKPTQSEHTGVESAGVQIAADALKILVVEDNEINRLVVTQLLTNDGHNVTTADDGYAGIAAAKAEVFDIILMDISMPSIDGTQVTKIIRSGDGLNAKTPITALTAHALDKDLQLFIAAGMNEVLVKPLTQKSLRAMISRMRAQIAAPALTISNIATVVNTPVVNAPVVNEDVVQQFKAEIGAELFGRLSHKFVDEADALLPELATSEPADAAKTAHKLAGSAAMFGASQLCKQLQTVEQNFKLGEDEHGFDVVQQILATWPSSKKELQDFYAQLIED